MRSCGFALITLSTFALLGAGCAHSTSAPRARAAQESQGAVLIDENGDAQTAPFARSGAEFEARLNQTIDTQTSVPGDVIEATLTRPIFATSGEELVPAGTVLRGHVVSIDHLHGPHVRLDFDSLLLHRGPAPVGVRILSAEQSRYERVPVPSGASGVTSMQPPAPRTPGSVQIEMPRGALIKFVLTRPIILERPVNR